MPYVTSVERLARKEGKAEGKAETILKTLEYQFRQMPSLSLQNALQAASTDQLDAWHKLAFEVDSLEEFERQVLSGLGKAD